MTKMYKGGSKIFILLIIITILIVSAIMFGYGGEEVQEIKNETTQKASEIIEEHSENVIENVVDNGKEKIGETLKDVGEKMLEENEYPGYYGNYGDEDVNEYEKVVLFFTADWCPSCVEAQENIESEKNKIPHNVAVINVDFDEEEQLKQEHEVSKQHTFVLVGREGMESKKWSGSKTLSEIIDNL